MTRIKPRNLLKLLLKVGFTALLLYFVFKKIHPDELLQILKSSNPVFLVLAFLTFAFSQLVSSGRLLTFLHQVPLPIRYLQNLKLYTVGMFYNMFLPGGIGGDAYKIFLLKKEFKQPVKDIFQSVFLDRVSGLWALGFCIALISFLPEILQPYLSWIILTFLSGTLIYFFILKWLFKKFLPQWFKKHFLAFVVQSLQVLTAYLILCSTHFSGSSGVYLLSFMASSLASVVPITLGGLGAREYVMIFGSETLGIDQNTGVFITATFWFISAFASLPGAFYTVRISRIFSKGG